MYWGVQRAAVKVRLINQRLAMLAMLKDNKFILLIQLGEGPQKIPSIPANPSRLMITQACIDANAHKRFLRLYERQPFHQPGKLILN